MVKNNKDRKNRKNTKKGKVADGKPVVTDPKIAEIEAKAVEAEKSAKLQKMTEKLSDSKDVKKTKKGDSKTSKKEVIKPKRFRRAHTITADDRMNKGVVYLGHIPYGFREEEIKDFFKQFGNVTRVRVARSKKTARPKGYAFIEFEHLETAAVAAETVNGRFMFDRNLVCQLIDDTNVHKDMFRNSGRTWKFIPYQKINTRKVNSDKTDLKRYKKVRRLLEQEEEKREKIQDFFNTIGKPNTYKFTGYKEIIDQSLAQVQQSSKKNK